ncbi:endogenous retrovirus group 3 member 1 Env polyprotein-like [Alligator mississippiensis]|uniref:endogenous retrovirus group 3 member 1 Env polyprotein-like n=1 Tax=Alligator mississippiensis TaxID=8496 RepID=UPI0028778301|nr:endogenous retrovirus group 3 member 1 Env polyprotein-like [Alligator mississippiensis]
MTAKFIMATVLLNLAILGAPNAYLGLLQKISIALNVSDCWVCGLSPRAYSEGFLMIPRPLSLENLTVWWADPNNATWTDARYLTVIPLQGEMCWVLNYSQQNFYSVGNSSCKHYDMGKGVWMNNHTKERTWCQSFNRWYNPYNQTSGTGAISCKPVKWSHITIWECSTLGGHCYRDGTIKSASPDSLGRPSPIGGRFTLDWYEGSFSNNQALQGTYWVCGTKAYHQLPPNWFRTCYLAWLTPPVRATKVLPPGHHRNKRESPKRADREQDAIATLESYKNPLTVGKLIGCSVAGIIPLITGPAISCLGRYTLRLQAVVEILAQETETAIASLGNAIKIIAGNQDNLRLMVMQNRLALDYVLASEGGACVVIGQECCTYVNSTFELVENQVNNAMVHAAKAAEAAFIPKDSSVDGFAWLDPRGLFKGLIGKIMSALCIVLILGLSLYVIVQLVLCCTKLCVKKSERTLSSISKETVKNMVLELRNNEIEIAKLWTDLCQIEIE